MVQFSPTNLLLLAYSWCTILNPSVSFPLTHHPHRSILTHSFTTTTTTTQQQQQRRRTQPLLYNSTPKKNNEIQDLKTKAQQLRQEVTQYEQQKQQEAIKEQQEREEQLTQQQTQRMRHAVTIPILKGDGTEVMETVDFAPKLSQTNHPSTILAFQASLPLGIILGESSSLPGMTQVDQVNDESNAFQSGIQVGDILRACSACQVTMEMPTWQLMAGGVGRPKTTRMMYSADGRPFEEVMEAVGSNRLDPGERPVWLVVERMVG